MVNGIALKFFSWVKEVGPTNGDTYDQDRLDAVWDAISGYIEIDVGLTVEEQEYIKQAVNFDEIYEALDALLNAEEDDDL